MKSSANLAHCHGYNDDGTTLDNPCEVCGVCVTCLIVGDGLEATISHLRDHRDDASMALAKVLESLGKATGAIR